LRAGVDGSGIVSPKARLVVLLLLVIVPLDQATKIIVDRMLPLHESIPVIENFFSLTYIRNTGAAFGLLAQSGELFRRTFLIGFSLAAIGFIIIMLRRLPENEKVLTIALGFILAGAVGNLIDRLLYGEVIDFLDFYWNGYHWPAFNVADSFITIGVVLIMVRLATSKDADPFAPRARIS
jgi:signal peptidase II